MPLDPRPLEVQVVGGLDQVDADAWDALTSPDDPFTTHAFLGLLEESGSVGEHAGWAPAHLLVRRSGDTALAGAAPLYVKDNSYGEYIFDWGWAEASHRARVPYYPKVVSAVPFTPATGRRFLVRPGEDERAVCDALLAGAHKVADVAEAMSIHVLFHTEHENHLLAPRDGLDADGLGPSGLVPRRTHQFHWTNDGYADFDDWLSRFRSKARKETRRERRVPASVTLRLARGTDIRPQDWRALRHFYQSTISRKWGHPYLTDEWWASAGARLGDLPVALLAEKGGQAVAGALLFQRGAHLYGRYWGCLPDHRSLHFELCYHRPIEVCIAEGWTHFEAGAQGSHKVKRGLLPASTWSVHWLRHPGLARAVAEAVGREWLALDEALPRMALEGPFRRGERGGEHDDGQDTPIVQDD